MASRTLFVDKTLQGALRFARAGFQVEEYATRPGLLQSLDPRAKVLGLLGLLVLLLFVKSPRLLGLAYLISLALAASSGIGLGFFLKRTLLFIPLFSLGFALPAALQIVTPGAAIAHLGPLVISRQGALGATVFVLRVAASVSLGVLMTLTTRQAELLKVLRTLGVPSLFVLILSMAMRYISLFVGLLERTFLAVKSRVGTVSHGPAGRQLVAWTMANLWTRSLQLNDKVYGAMLSRGFTGEPVLLTGFRFRRRDAAWLLGVALLGAALLWAQGVGL